MDLRSLSLLFSLFSLKWWRRRAEKFSLLSLSFSSQHNKRALEKRRGQTGRSSGKKIGVGFELGKRADQNRRGSFSLAFALSSVFLSLSGKEKKIV